MKEKQMQISINGVNNKTTKFKRIMEYIHDDTMDISERDDIHNIKYYYCGGDAIFKALENWNKQEKAIFERLFNHAIPYFFADRYGNAIHIWDNDEEFGKGKNVSWHNEHIKNIPLKDILKKKSNNEIADMLLKYVWFKEYHKTNKLINAYK